MTPPNFFRARRHLDLGHRGDEAESVLESEAAWPAPGEEAPRVDSQRGVGVAVDVGEDGVELAGVVRRRPKPVGPGVLMGCSGTAFSLNPAGPVPFRVTICSPVSGAPFMTMPRFGELVVRNAVAAIPLTVVVAVHEVALGVPPGVKKPGFR
jgi:hypothetical protein